MLHSEHLKNARLLRELVIQVYQVVKSDNETSLQMINWQLQTKTLSPKNTIIVKTTTREMPCLSRP